MTRKVLIVLTSAKDTPWGKDTGYWLEELAAPYNAFVDAGMEVEIASIKGGKPPVDAGSLAESFLTEDTRRFSADPVATAKVEATKPISEFVGRASEFSAVFLPGGHGTALDFAGCKELKAILEEVYANHGVVSAVCHGPCGLVSLVDKATGVS